MKIGLRELFIFLVLILSACKPALQPEYDESINILFIGNSYTFVNDMPEIFAELAKFGGHNVNVTSLAKAGFSLNDHAEDPDLGGVLKANTWDYVILQEKSSLPVVDMKLMEQGVSQLIELAEEHDAEIVLFMPWAYQAGFPEAGMADYHTMQSKVVETYQDLAREFDISSAPVGLTWQSALEHHPELDLWSPDGSHPSLSGSYLAALTFYAHIFQESPAGLNYPISIPADIELVPSLEEIAAETVLGIPGEWNP
jgi:hypothetical protein